MNTSFAAKFSVAAVLCLLLALGSLLSAPEARSAGCRLGFSFRYLGPYSSQQTTYETAVADFDGDGHLDLAVVEAAAGTIDIYHGNGDGTFAAPVSYPAPGFPQAITAADFNGDGRPDLAAGVIYGIGVLVCLNDGNGGFGPSTLYAAGSYPNQVVAADFNGDGKLDLSVPDPNASTNQVLLGDGHGGFGAPIATSGGSGGYAVAGDFNRDGKMDLAVVWSDLKILLGNGAGGFTVGNSYSFGPGSPTRVTMGDFNRDHIPDIAVAVSNSEPQVYTFLGDGMGGLVPSSPGGDTHAWGIAAADLDGDGRVDIVTADYGYNTIAFAKGNGRGDFATLRTYAIPHNRKNSPLPINLTTGDFNEDGLPDVVTSDYGLGGVTVAITQCR
jgi:hypothetical protein